MQFYCSTLLAKFWSHLLNIYITVLCLQSKCLWIQLIFSPLSLTHIGALYVAGAYVCKTKYNQAHPTCIAITNVKELIFHVGWILWHLWETINVLLGVAHKAPSQAECAALPEPHRRFSWCQSGATAKDRSPNEHVLLLATLFLFAVLHLLSVYPIDMYAPRPAQGRERVNVCLSDRKDLPFDLFLGFLFQAQLRAFIPEMLKYSTGRGKPGWGKESCKPVWWPDDIPWANVRSDVRTEEQKQRVRSILVQLFDWKFFKGSYEVGKVLGILFLYFSGVNKFGGQKIFSNLLPIRLSKRCLPSSVCLVFLKQRPSRCLKFIF